MRKLFILLIISFYVIIFQQCKNSTNQNILSNDTDDVNLVDEKKKFSADWESLSKHDEEPDWFKDSKFGIYFHWGVYSVPAHGGEWYPRLMHIPTSDEYKYHKKIYGKQSKFGYHNFVPMFKAEKFNAEEWADLFEKAGAKFAGPVAEHHDGFSMWDSEITPWNVKDTGPKKDITGELKQAITEKGLKFITTFHHARNLQRYGNDLLNEDIDTINWRTHWNSHYPFIKGMSTSSDNKKLKSLYGNIPKDEWHQTFWLGKLKEVIDKYQPDIIWFDSWLDLIPVEQRIEFCAYYLNAAEEWGKEVVIVRKQDDLPLDVSVDDLEKSRKNKMDKKIWMTDETISNGSWCYTDNLQIKPAKELLHILIDIVSKNGVLLLNISPKADGTIPIDQKNTLLSIGSWLRNYGQAIYKTRPWYTYGEGPTKEPEGNFENHEKFLGLKYSNRDVRYTTNGNTIYAIILGKPVTGNEILLEAFAKKEIPRIKEIKGVSLLETNEQVKWKWIDNGLNIKIPKLNEEMAVVFKINYTLACR